MLKNTLRCDGAWEPRDGFGTSVVGGCLSLVDMPF